MFLLRRLLLMTLATGLVLTAPLQAQAEAGREFLLSCTYGVIAGALVGAASLAVEDNPGDKIHRVARGASLGLYTGILLGVYVVYVVPAQLEAEQEAEQEEELDKAIDADDYGFRPTKPKIRMVKEYRVIEPPKLTVFPVMENNRITGATLNYSIANF
jgi:hypothetical protein